MCGGVHIEMALWKVVGACLSESGWTVARADAGIATQGTAESFLIVSHVMRTRRAHQVTILALSVLRQRAFQQVYSAMDDETFEDWVKYKK